MMKSVGTSKTALRIVFLLCIILFSSWQSVNRIVFIVTYRMIYSATFSEILFLYSTNLTHLTIGEAGRLNPAPWGTTLVLCQGFGELTCF